MGSEMCIRDRRPGIERSAFLFYFAKISFNGAPACWIWGYFNRSNLFWTVVKINGKPAFERQKNDVELFDNEPFSSKWRISGSRKLIKLLAQESLKPHELFLTNGFKCLVSQEIVSMIESWFGEHLCTLDLSRNLSFEASRHSQ